MLVYDENKRINFEELLNHSLIKIDDYELLAEMNKIETSYDYM